ncbi:hypothetical protein GCM10022600_01680 [Qipengyuania pelagi]|jgi:hypothetical protein|uniref:PilZ domain-containing protein n=1 Tax=Qipengyuania pelagi TaxID=994320 RepID=A0A844Y8F9_9SPHN|nr:PilZ domain-containing protein [Qipengyuania pelagi]MXO54554.1 PilZ domain-containing protein [Qipengyuania pelagi]
MSAVDTRNVSRDSLFLMADITVDGSTHPVRAKVRNLSAGGMMADGDFTVERGMRLVVDLRHVGHVTGTVAWVQDSRIGIAFDKEIDPKQVRARIGVSESTVPAHIRTAPAFTDPQIGKRRL